MNKMLSLLAATILSLATISPAAAIPKAAESESAAVTSGADAPRPKKAKVTNSNPTTKKSVRKAKGGLKAKRGKVRR